MIEGLPLEFKLFMKKKHVGYMKIDIGHVVTKKLDCLAIYLSKDGENWSKRIYPHQVRPSMALKIIFDEMRQNTGYKIKNRKVYFGDKLKDGNGTWNILKVEISEDGEIVAANNMFGCFAKDFKIMELTNDTP